MVYLCTHCGHLGYRKAFTKGHFGIEVALWLLLIVPGVIYTLWRLISRYQGCPTCQQPGMIPESSPVAIKLLRDLAASKTRSV